MTVNSALARCCIGRARPVIMQQCLNDDCISQVFKHLQCHKPNSVPLCMRVLTKSLRARADQDFCQAASCIVPARGVAQWAIRLYWRLLSGCMQRHLLMGALASGRVALVRWMWQQSPACAAKVNRTACEVVAACGQLESLQWLRSQLHCQWDGSTCRHAAEHGHLHVLEWAQGNGCPIWDCAAIAAAHGGQLHVLQWLAARGCNVDRELAQVVARHRGHDHVLRWLDQQPPGEAVTSGCRAAVLQTWLCPRPGAITMPRGVACTRP